MLGPLAEMFVLDRLSSCLQGKLSITYVKGNPRIDEAVLGYR